MSLVFHLLLLLLLIKVLAHIPSPLQEVHFQRSIMILQTWAELDFHYLGLFQYRRYKMAPSRSVQRPAQPSLFLQQPLMQHQQNRSLMFASRRLLLLPLKTLVRLTVRRRRSGGSVLAQVISTVKDTIMILAILVRFVLTTVPSWLQFPVRFIVMLV